jgi:hypothetical protein
MDRIKQSCLYCGILIAALFFYIIPGLHAEKGRGNQVPGEHIPMVAVRNGLPRTFHKLQLGKDVNIVYLGGSITNHEGYRVYTTDWLRKQYPAANITSVNSGIGGTGSLLGVFRLDNDVLKHKPDLVFVEFAVNDADTDSVMLCNAIEGIVRKIKKNNPDAEICFIYTIAKPMLPDFEKGQPFRSVRLMERIAAYYGIPSMNFGVDVFRLLQKDKLVFQAEKGVKMDGKVIFSHDNVHPTLDEGHKVYAETFAAAMLELKNIKTFPSSKLLPAMYENLFAKAKMYSPDEFIRTEGWKRISETHPFFKTNKTRCPDLVLTDNPADSISIRFKGRIIGVYDIIGPDSKGLNATVDGKELLNIQRFDKFATYYRNSYTLLPLLSEKWHTVSLKMNIQELDKEAILRTKQDNVLDENKRKQLNDNVLYIGYILVAGKVRKK